MDNSNYLDVDAPDLSYWVAGVGARLGFNGAVFTSVAAGITELTNDDSSEHVAE